MIAEPEQRSLDWQLSLLEPFDRYAGPGERIIHLSRGFQTVVNEEDYAVLATFNWTVQLDYNRRKAYAVRWETIDRRRFKIYMHRVIARPPKGAITDHADGDGLNNRRGNLRVCGYHENAANGVFTKLGFVQYRGVTFEGNRFRARITFLGEREHLGYFDSAEEAARAYDRRALEMFGEFALVNFPKPIPARRPEEPIPF